MAGYEYDPGLRGKKVRGYRLRGEFYSASQWKQLYLSILEHLYAKNPAEFEKKIMMLNEGTKRTWFSTDIRRIQDEPKQIGRSGIYAETKWNANQIEDRCLEVLKRFGYQRNEFRIEFD